VTSKPEQNAPTASRNEARDSASGPARRRGRPARLSRERIVAAVLDLLEERPDEVPTTARIAKRVNAVPAALYRHFEGLDEILDAVITHVLETGPSDLNPEAPWQEQLSNWMHGLRTHLLNHPAVLAMIDRAGRTSPAWLEASSALVEILARAGLSGGALARNYLWVLETTVGLVIQEAAMPLAVQLSSARAARTELSETARRRFAPIVDEIESIDAESFFEFAVARTTEGVRIEAHGAQTRESSAVQARGARTTRGVRIKARGAREP
jgi:AcrR family transcriptional regulator